MTLRLGSRILGPSPGQWLHGHAVRRARSFEKRKLPSIRERDAMKCAARDLSESNVIVGAGRGCFQSLRVSYLQHSPSSPQTRNFAIRDSPASGHRECTVSA